MKTNLFQIGVLMVISVVMAGCASPQVKNNMKYRELGNTGLKVSEIGLGCGGFGEMTPDEARSFMDIAIAGGINYIDLYDANPTVRDNIGYSIKGRSNKMMIQGHIGTCWVNGQYKRTRDLTETKAGFEDMLKRLGTKSIEVGMIHITDTPEQWNELEGSEYLAYVQQLKKEGKIKHIGVSSHNAEVALMAAKSGLVEVIMFSLNPVFDKITSTQSVWDDDSYKNMLSGIDPVRVELYDYCARHGIAITVMKVFAGGGRLLHAESSPLGFALTPVQCISYCLSKPCVSTALCGADNIEELEFDLYYLLATEDEKDYNKALLVGKQHQSVFGNCTYCSHCAPCPQSIDISKINELLDKALQQGEISVHLQKEYDALEKDASDCILCGSCETRCPFDVPIRDRMEKATQLFESVK